MYMNDNMIHYTVYSLVVCTVAEFCLIHLISSKHPTVFYQNFVECLFFYNSYEKHKGKQHDYICMYVHDNAISYALCDSVNMCG